MDKDVKVLSTEEVDALALSSNSFILRCYATVRDRERQRDVANAELKYKEDARRGWAETAAKFHAERDELQRRSDDLKQYLDNIASALLSPKKDERFTYLPQQLAGMVEELQRQLAEVRKAIALVHGPSGCACINDLPGDNYTCKGHRTLMRIARESLDAAREAEHG